jgi:branched-chain amino acid transport system substrate-binding protein
MFARGGKAMKRAAVILLLASASMFFLGTCSSAGRREPEIDIGFIAPLTGELRDLGASCLEGAGLALQEIEDSGGSVFEGRRHRINLVLKDSQNKPELAVRAAQELINHNNVAVIIGPPVSSLAIPVARLACQAGVPMITQISTHPEVTRDKECVFRTCFTDTFQGEVMARFARENLGAGKAAVLFDIASPYNRGITEIFVHHFAEAGGEVVAYESYTTGQKDFRRQLRRIAASRPDVLFLPNYVNEVRLQMDQLHELGIEVQVIGSDTMSFRNAEDIARIEGAYFSTHFSAEIPDQRVQEFSAAYRSNYQREPTAAGALTYDALQLFFSVARTQGSTAAEKILTGLENLQQYVGVTGVMEFLGSPDPRKSVVIIHVQDGAFRYFTRIDP